MKCPFCNHHESKVTDSRNVLEMNTIRRRRECLHCFQRFTTFETIDLTLQVKKRDGTYEDFQQEKLIKGLEAACKHSKISHDKMKAIVNRITVDLVSRQVREIAAEELGDIVMQHLEKTDVVAFIRFACVYRRFKDIKEVMEAIESITPKEDRKNNLLFTSKEG